MFFSFSRLFVVLLVAGLLVPWSSSVAGDQTEDEAAFWAFQSPQWSPPSARPLSEGSLDHWITGSLDHWVGAFLLESLRVEGLPVSERAQDEAFFRRQRYVLTGLPPRPEDREAFLGAEDPNKRQRWTDRWLASYAFGERMTSFWLPIARYAEDQAHMVGNNEALNYPGLQQNLWVKFRICSGNAGRRVPLPLDPRTAETTCFMG